MTRLKIITSAAAALIGFGIPVTANAGQMSRYQPVDPTYDGGSRAVDTLPLLEGRSAAASELTSTASSRDPIFGWERAAGGGGGSGSGGGH